MDFLAGEDAETFASVLCDFFTRRGDARAIAEASASGTAMSRARWTALCELGLPALLLPEPEGVGASLNDAVAVAERLGAVLLPEPATASMVLASTVDGVLDGSRIAAIATTRSGRVRVPDDELVDLVALVWPTRSALLLVDRVTPAKVGDRCDVDPTRPTVECDLDDVEPVETVPMTSGDIDTLLRNWAVLTLGELVGGMQGVLDSTLAFATERVQFGRPIGGFQAVKHQLADMYLAVEQARAAVQFAAIRCDTGDASAACDVAAAARWVPRSAIDLFATAIHLHGAMGYSWEVGVHLHLRRAVSTRTLLSETGVTEPRRVSPEHGIAS